MVPICRTHCGSSTRADWTRPPSRSCCSRWDARSFFAVIGLEPKKRCARHASAVMVVCLPGHVCVPGWGSCNLQLRNCKGLCACVDFAATFISKLHRCEHHARIGKSASDKSVPIELEIRRSGRSRDMWKGALDKTPSVGTISSKILKYRGMVSKFCTLGVHLFDA